MKIKYSYHNSLILVLSLLAVLSAGSLAVYFPHRWYPGPFIDPDYGNLILSPLGNYPYPLHVDGWNHLAQSRYLFADSEPGKNPQVKGILHTSLEQGFHYFLATFAKLLGVSLISLAPILPILFFVLSSIGLFLFFYSLGRPFSSLIAISLLALIPSNANTLGPWFIVPLNLFPFFVFTFLAIPKMVKGAGLLMLLSLLFILSSITYPPASFFQLLYIFFLVFHKYLPRKNTSKVFLTIFLFFIAPLVMILLLKNVNPLVFSTSWAVLNYDYLLPFLFPPAIAVLSVVSLIWWLSEDASVDSLFVSGVLSFLTVLFVFYKMAGFTVVIPYQRIMYIFSLFLVVPISIFLDKTSEVIVHLLRSSFSFFVTLQTRYPPIGYLVRSLILLSFSSLLFILLFPALLDPEYEGTLIQRLASPEEISLMYLVPENSTVLAPPFSSVAVYPISGSYIVSGINGNLGGADRYLYKKFVLTDCLGKWGIILGKGVTHIISPIDFGCGFLLRYASSGHYKLYVVVS